MPKICNVCTHRAKIREEKSVITEAQHLRIKQLTKDIHRRAKYLKASTSELVNSRKRLQHCLDEIVIQEDSLRERVTEFQKTNDEFKNVLQDVSSSYNFKNKNHAAELNFNIALSQQNTVVAQEQINQIKNELDFQSPIVPEFRDTKYRVYRCFDKVIIRSTPFNTISEPSIAKKKAALCSICFQNKINRVVIGCGHMCLCSKCAPAFLGPKPEQNGNCPICRMRIKDIIEPKFI